MYKMLSEAHKFDLRFANDDDADELFEFLNTNSDFECDPSHPFFYRLEGPRIKMEEVTKHCCVYICYSYA